MDDYYINKNRFTISFDYSPRVEFTRTIYVIQGEGGENMDDELVVRYVIGISIDDLPEIECYETL